MRDEASAVDRWGRSGDRPTLTAAGAVMLALGAGLLGALVDVVTGPGLRTVFAVAFVAGCLAATALVRRESLLTVLVMPPLVYLALAFFASLVESGGSSSGWLRQQVLELGSSLVLSAPALIVAVLGSVVVAVVRGRRYRMAAASGGEPFRPSGPGSAAPAGRGAAPVGARTSGAPRRR